MASSTKRERLEFILDRAEVLLEELQADSLKDLAVQMGCFLGIFVDYIKDEMNEPDNDISRFFTNKSS